MEEQNTHNVEIYKPDNSLKKKIGNIDTTQLINADKIKDIEQVIEKSADVILQETSGEIEKILKFIALLKEKGEFTEKSKNELVSVAFSVKSKAGFCGYPLISSVAKSMYLFCETRKENASLTKQEIDIISWHGDAISAILSKQVKDASSDFGNQLTSELDRIRNTFIK